MGYFLKQTKNKKGIYLQIYESFHDSKRGYAAHRSVRPLGYVHDLESATMPDPIAYYKAEVKQMNEARLQAEAAARVKEIGTSQTQNMGHFLARGVLNRLDVARDISFLTFYEKFQFDLYELLTSLVYARLLEPSSKRKTYLDVLPSLPGGSTYSPDQMYRGLAFLGERYDDVVEIINYRYNQKYKRKTDTVYFDATNFYFEIDAEDNLRRKGPSKENRLNPLLGMGLLIDAEQIPLAVSFFPGNQSEISELPKTITTMKERYRVSGKTVQVADKGLNCTKNITEAVQNGDGYIFSQSIKKLSEVEKKWVFNEHNEWTKVKDHDGNLMYEYTSAVDDFPYLVANRQGKKTEVLLRQKRVVTFNPDLARKQIAEINKQVEKVGNLSARAAMKSEYGDAKKYVNFLVSDEDGVIAEDVAVKATLNMAKIAEDKQMAGYNLLITSEVNMHEREIYKTYHTLWRIEETFRILKSKLEARPVYVQTREAIYGHFFINYIAVFLLRVLQIKVFADEVHPHQLLDFIKNFNILNEKGVNINLGNRAKIEPIEKVLKLGLYKYYLEDKQLAKLLKYKI